MDLSRLACKILERVRDFRSNFTWTEPKRRTRRPERSEGPGKGPKSKKVAAKVYAKQPTKPSIKTKTAKTKTARGRATVKK